MVSELSLENIYFKYPGDEFSLKNITLTFTVGRIYCIVGPNGSGKSTLLLVIAGLLKPLKGKILVDGVPLDEQLPRIRSKIGIVFQNPDHMLFNPTVYDEIAYGPRQLYRREKVDRLVEKTSRELGLDKLLSKPVHKLSFGEKKLVSIAAILSYEPDIILLDEPFSNLHSSKKKLLLNILLNIKNKGKIIIITSPGLQDTPEICDQIIHIENGRITSIKINKNFNYKNTF